MWGRINIVIVITLGILIGSISNGIQAEELFRKDWSRIKSFYNDRFWTTPRESYEKIKQNTSKEKEDESTLSNNLSEKDDISVKEDDSNQSEKSKSSVIIGSVPVEMDQNARLLSETENKVVVKAYNAEKVAIAQSSGGESIMIEYKGTKITFDSNIVGKITVDEKGVWIYDKEGDRIGGITEDGSFWKIKDDFVLFDKGVNLLIKGDNQGKTNYIEAETDAGKYIFKLENDQLTVSSPSQDTLTIDTTKFHSLLLGKFSKEGEGWLSFYTQDSNQHIRAGFNSQGKIEKIALSTKHTEQLSPNSYKVTWETHEISLDSEEGVNLNLTANEDGSVTIASNVENSVQIKFNKDGTIEAVTPEGESIPIPGKVEKVTFKEDGSAVIKLENNIVITAGSENITIEYGETKLKIDSNLIGEIKLNEYGNIQLYDKDGNYLGYITSEGWGRIWLGGRSESPFGNMSNCVHFDSGVTVEVSGDDQGNINLVKVITDAGDYSVKKTDEGTIKVTTFGGDTFSYNINDVEGGDLYFKKDGSAWLDIWTKGWDKSIRVICDSTGKIVAVNNYVFYPERNEIVLDRDENVNLNLTANEDGSVTIASNVENSVQIKFNKDGTIEAVTPEGESIPIPGKVEKVTFKEDGSAVIKLENNIVITAGSENITIEYGETKLKIDSNLIGEIKLNEYGNIQLYDKDGNYLGYITSEGWGRIWLGGRSESPFGNMSNCVHFDSGVTVEVSGDDQGNINLVKVITDAGDYSVKKTDEGTIKVTTFGGDTFSYNINDVEGGDLYFKKDGSAWLDIWTKGWDKSIRVICDSTGKIVAVNNYVFYPERNEIVLDRDENVNLNLTANEDGSVTIASNVENSVQIKFNKDGTIEAVTPEGESILITGDVDKVTFKEDGSVIITFKNGESMTISIDILKKKAHYERIRSFYSDRFFSWSAISNPQN